MKMVKIYRIENASGVGPYQGTMEMDPCEPRRKMSNAHTGESHPSGPEDFPWLYWNGDEFFGFDSAEAAVVWFDVWLKVLEDDEFSMTEWLVPEFYIQRGDSGRQVVFPKGVSKLVTSYPPTEIYERG